MSAIILKIINIQLIGLFKNKRVMIFNGTVAALIMLVFSCC